jgi:cytochrome c oxidase cbb3-type subunit 3
MKKNALICLLSGMFIAQPSYLLAQGDTAPTTGSADLFANPLFLTLIGVIIVLGLLIGVLGGTIVNLLKYKYKLGNTHKKALSLTALFVALFSGNQAQAADIAGIHTTAFWLLVLVILAELFVISWFVLVIYRIFEKEKVKEAVITEKAVRKQSALSRLWSKLNDSVAIEKEADVLLDHDYDGIKELDNNLPPWWKYGFYFTILFGIGYLAYFHFMSGPNQEEELQRSLAKAAQEIEAYKLANPSKIDPDKVMFLSAAADLKAGKELYIKNKCQTCHGEQLEGNVVGPNLVDAYWLHGGSLSAVFKTISNGVQGTAMQAWNKSMSDQQILQLASYIQSMQGTNPMNAKEPQGDKYEAPSETNESQEDAVENNNEA